MMGDFTSFVALGDSFTEGVGDPGRGEHYRGWADRFAEYAAAGRPGLGYANLAIRGKVLGEVIEEQIPPTLAMRPDLVSIAAGGNDLLRPRADPDALAATFESAIAMLRSSGSTVMVFTGFDPSAFPVLRLIRGRAAVYNMHLRSIASAHECLLVDLWPMRVLTDRRMWMPDRLHLAPDGHRRVALMACEVAGVAVGEDWRTPLPRVPASPGLMAALANWATARRGDMHWLTEHAAPYVNRRLRGISSGDGMTPKRPELTRIEGRPRDSGHPDGSFITGIGDALVVRPGSSPASPR